MTEDCLEGNRYFCPHRKICESESGFVYKEGKNLTYGDLLRIGERSTPRDKLWIRRNRIYTCRPDKDKDKIEETLWRKNIRLRQKEIIKCLLEDLSK
ncbi:MAG: hypothetical protein ABIJ14_01255 [Nanoarchaeota archaeon]|nr:hypothetical protein [Nanoarchaeota archaeon]